MAVVRDIAEEMFRGDGRNYEITITDEDDVVVDITGAKIWFTLKSSYDEADADAEFQLSSADASEIALTDPVNGIAEIYISNDNTKDLLGQTYYFDVQLVELGEQPRTVIRGSMKIKPDVTLDIT